MTHTPVVAAGEILFRCSSLGHIMTDSRTKGETISKTTKTHLVDVYISKKYGRSKEIYSKFLDKGISVEEESITLYSLVKRRMFQKNERHLSNQWIMGTPDLFIGESIEKADEIIDIKSSWDIFTFMRSKHGEINEMYYWQLQGYMALTGAKTATLAYCLTDTPESLIVGDCRKLAYQTGVIDPDTNADYLAACAEIERNSRYSDIPNEERVHTFTIERNEEDILRLYNRVEQCRKWMNENLFNTEQS